MQINQRLYLLSLLQSSSLQRSSLHLLLNALVINKLTYALPAYAGQLTADDKNRINAISRKAMRCGLTLTAFDIDALIDQSDHKPFWQATQPGHSLHIFSLLKPLPTDLTSLVRDDIHISFPLFNRVRTIPVLGTGIEYWPILASIGWYCRIGIGPILFSVIVPNTGQTTVYGAVSPTTTI